MGQTSTSASSRHCHVPGEVKIHGHLWSCVRQSLHWGPAQLARHKSGNGAPISSASDHPCLPTASCPAEPPQQHQDSFPRCKLLAVLYQSTGLDCDPKNASCHQLCPRVSVEKLVRQFRNKERGVSVGTGSACSLLAAAREITTGVLCLLCLLHTHLARCRHTRSPRTLTTSSEPGQPGRLGRSGSISTLITMLPPPLLQASSSPRGSCRDTRGCGQDWLPFSTSSCSASLPVSVVSKLNLIQ